MKFWHYWLWIDPDFKEPRNKNIIFEKNAIYEFEKSLAGRRPISLKIYIEKTLHFFGGNKHGIIYIRMKSFDISTVSLKEKY